MPPVAPPARTIRTAASGDVGALARVWCAVYAEHSSFHIADKAVVNFVDLLNRSYPS